MYIVHVVVQDRDGSRQRCKRYECVSFPVSDRTSAFMEFNTRDGIVSWAKDCISYLAIMLGAD